MVGEVRRDVRDRARPCGAPDDTAQRLAVALAQGGEFAFVLFSAAAALGVIAAATDELLVMAVTLSMLLARFAFAAHERAARALARRAAPSPSTTPSTGPATR